MATEKIKCEQCGHELADTDKFCPNCGAQIIDEEETVEVLRPTNRKSRLAAGLLAFFLGSLGIHNFYLGKTNLAITQLLLTTIGSFFTCGISAAAVQIWAMIEGVMILASSDGYTTDGQGNPLGE